MKNFEVKDIKMNKTYSLMVETFADFSRRSKTGELKLFLLEYYNELKSQGMNLPDGFIIHPFCFDHFCTENELEKKLSDVISSLKPDHTNLKEISLNAKALILTSSWPKILIETIQYAGKALREQSSPSAKMILKSYKNYDSNANYDIFMSIHNEEELLDACKQVFASLFSEKAIKERLMHDGLDTGIYMTVQKMIRSDIAGSGIVSTYDPIEGDGNSMVLYGCWGMSQGVGQDITSCDEYHISKPLLRSPRNAVYSKRAGTKEKTLIYFNTSDGEKANLFYIDTPLSKRDKFVISDKEATQLAKWALLIEECYGQSLGIEWAKDGLSNELFIVHAPVNKIMTGKTST